MKGKLTQLAMRAADALAPIKEKKPAHLVTGTRGEDAAYFYLRSQGYVMVARNFRSPRHRGEIDLIGWEGEILCFIEVKTRSERGMVPAELAVDHAKQSLLKSTARDYLRRLKGTPPARFDIVSLYFHSENAAPDITLFKNAFPMS